MSPGKLTSRNWGAIQKLRARKRRRQRWILRQLRGASHASVGTLHAEFVSLHPAEAVSIRTFSSDLRELKDTMTVCAWCRRRVSVEELVGEDVRERS